MNETTSRLPEDGGGYYRLWIQWNPDNFKVLILQKEFAWSGEASRNHVEQSSQLLQLSIEEYMKETKAALSTQGGMQHFSYLVDNGQFVWKKLDQTSNIKIKFGYIKLEQVSFHESAERMLDILFGRCNDLETDVAKLQNSNYVMNKERTILMEKLVEYKKHKLLMEQDLYGRFMAVLNAKKAHIKDLEDAEPGCSSSAPQQSTKASEPSNNSNHYDSDTDVEVNTDDERTEPKPLVVHHKLFDDDDDDDRPVKLPRIKRFIPPKRKSYGKQVVQDTAGPSTSKPKRQDEDDCMDTDALLDEF